MPYTTVSLADLKVLMAARWDASVFWSDDEARLAMNETLRDWNLLTGRWRRSVVLSTAAATPEVSLPSTLTYGMRVRVGTVPLVATSYTELDLARPTWRGETTASGGDVPTTPILWAPISLTQIAIWPSTAGVGVNNVLVDGVSATPVLSEDADTVDLGDEILDVVVDCAIHNAAFKEGGARWQATILFFHAFFRAAAEENQLLKAKQIYKRFAGLDRTRDLAPTRTGRVQLAPSDLPLLLGGDQ
jgi:hypothetical protein